MHRLKTQPIFTKASPTERRESFDFPTGLFRFFHVNGKSPQRFSLQRANKKQTNKQKTDRKWMLNR